jgi:hypothetical protein
MTRPTCQVCGGPRIPIPGWPPNLKIHPLCLPEGHVVWTRQQMAEWLAVREQTSVDTTSSTTASAKGTRAA